MQPNTKICRLVVVDDNPAVHRLVVGVIPDEFEMVEALEDGTRLPAAIATHNPDLVILDITLPVLSGIQLARQLKASGCKARIVFLTLHNDPDYVREALDAGADAYVLKMSMASDLVPALRAALTGQKFLSPPLKLEQSAPTCQN